MNWTDIARSIPKGRTILVLGPDAIPFFPSGKEISEDLPEEPSFSQIYRMNIREKLNGKITHYYQRDNLFLFASPDAKREAMESIEDTIFFNEWLPDSELIRKIVAIPFPVILNFNPDKYVYEAFVKLFREPQFDYFTTRHKSGSHGVNFDPDGHQHPLVYNVCGSVMDALDSVILDHYDLFSLLKAMLNDTGVPEKLTAKLESANRFILLGFDLERWYFQVFLHYLNRLGNKEFNNSNNNYPILSNLSDDTREFVMQQFKIEHFASSREDFESLYNACVELGGAEKGFLRKINDSNLPLADQIRLLVTQGKMEEAFNLIEQHCEEGELKNVQLPLLRSRYSEWLDNQRGKLHTEEQLHTDLNKIRYSIFTFISEAIK